MRHARRHDCGAQRLHHTRGIVPYIIRFLREFAHGVFFGNADANTTKRRVVDDVHLTRDDVSSERVYIRTTLYARRIEFVLALHRREHDRGIANRACEHADGI